MAPARGARGAQYVLAFALPLAVRAGGKICQMDQGGLVLPLFGNAEQETSTAAGFGTGFMYFRALYYFLGLLWFFLGVSIIADVFMAAIETITSKEKTIPGTDIKYKVWNATVANLTLMALGSSAPEILLSVIEILTNNFFTGDLGPSTIVGSAAFNLFCIVAICMVALPEGETRKIEEMTVYKITGFFSVFAYIWLLIILMGPWSPDVVDIWEAVLTFMFFPVLVALAFAADKGYLDAYAAKVLPVASHVTSVGATAFRAHEFTALLTKLKDPNLHHAEREDIIKKLASGKKAKPSRAVQRMNAVRAATGQKTVKAPGPDPKVLAKYLEKAMGKSVNGPRAFFSDENGHINTKYALLESDGAVTLNITRTPADGEMVVGWSTRDGTAKGSEPGADKKEDFEAAKGELVFKDKENFKSITITIYDDTETEVDEVFYVDLLKIKHGGVENMVPGDAASASVTIIDDDEPGTIAFEPPANTHDGVNVTVSEEARCAKIKVQRTNGSNGTVSCEYKITDGTAQKGIHYSGEDGTLVFNNTEVEKFIEIPLINTMKNDGEHGFQVTLEGLKGPERAELGECNRARVTVVASDESKQMIDDVHQFLAAADHGSYDVGSATYKAQFVEAWHVGGGEEGFEPGTSDYVMHVITLPWKLIFATVPPTCYAGGWLCFFVALTYIGIVTAFIGDLAALMGCCLGLKDVVTAITFVALGTSLPDAFASKAATVNDDTADAAIGNVTGSNAVNVFLGLGLPWSIAAIYWQGGMYSDDNERKWRVKYGMEMKEGGVTYERKGTKGPPGAKCIGCGEDSPIGFVVPAGALGLSVGTFVVCALSTIALLAYRRKNYGAELGGDSKVAKKHATFLVGLWFVYVIVSILSTEGLV